MVGMYIHTHWAYRRPYAARTWTVEDWGGYLSGLHALGYDQVMVWPQLDCMPARPRPDDLAFLQVLREAIDIARGQFGMKTLLVCCANTMGNERAAAYPFLERPYFLCERKVNPRDPGEVGVFLESRRRLFEPLANAHGVAIIDSDPGGYIDSRNREFVDLVKGQIDAFRAHNAEGEFVYWMLAGWESYNRFWKAQRDEEHPDPNMWEGWQGDDFGETLSLMTQAIEEPWWLLAWRDAHHTAVDEAGLRDKAVYYPYGVIEGEPTYPVTNFDPRRIARDLPSGQLRRSPRGVMANAQTHCLQLPHTYAFAHLAQGGRFETLDFAVFADQLLPGLGSAVAEGWGQLEQGEPDARRRCAAALRNLRRGDLPTGPLRGLLFGDANRFLADLADNLDARAALAELGRAVESGAGIPLAVGQLLRALGPYQERHGYRDAYGGPFYDLLNVPLKEIGDPTLDTVLRDFEDWRTPSLRHGVVPRLLHAMETFAGGPAAAS